jgi:hypothetical protein
MHDQFASDHSNVNKIIRLLRRNYRWSEMIRDVKQFIKNCHICRRSKAVRNKYNELLNFLSISNRSWIDIILNFVIELFESRNYNAVFMIINRLSKMHHYISCTTNENETTTEKTTKLFIQHVWKLHELLITMIFDRDSQFIFLVWNTICKMLKIKTKLFIAFHSKTNEQSEIFNQKMKRYLRVYVNHQQNDWADWLSMTKYAFNAFISIITQMFSFLVNYEFESRMSFDHIEFNENTIRERINSLRRRKIVFTMKKIWNFVKKHMKKVNDNKQRTLTHIESLFRTIKLTNRYDSQLKIYKSTNHQENSIIKCSNHSKYWKKETVRTSLICQTKWILIQYFTHHCFERISKIFYQSKSSLHHHQLWLMTNKNLTSKTSSTHA